jgi:hypothetical protein
MHRIKLIASLLVAVLAVGSLLFVWQLGGSGKRVEITSFHVGGWYSGAVFPMIDYPFNLTIHNNENALIGGLAILIKTLDSDSNPVEVQGIGSEQTVRFNGILEANETRTITGWFLSELDSSTRLLVVQVKSGNDILDEFQTELN